MILPLRLGRNWFSQPEGGLCWKLNALMNKKMLKKYNRLDINLTAREYEICFMTTSFIQNYGGRISETMTLVMIWKYESAAQRCLVVREDMQTRDLLFFSQCRKMSTVTGTVPPKEGHRYNQIPWLPNHCRSIGISDVSKSCIHGNEQPRMHESFSEDKDRYLIRTIMELFLNFPPPESASASML